MNDDLQTIIVQLNDIRSLLEAVVEQLQQSAYVAASHDAVYQIRSRGTAGNVCGCGQQFCWKCNP